MDTALIVDILLKVVGGLGIFLLGMKNMSEGIQAVAGERLRKLISSVTDNRLMACGIGTAITCLVQSSSVTTVMVVGLVNAGFMTLVQAIGVILGANIGTTITGWILVLKIGKYGLPILGIFAIVYLFSRKEKLRYIAMAVMGIGMVFFGLELMSGGFKPLRTMPEFVAWFSRFSAESYFGIFKCILAGCIVTMIVQSSSATLGITIGLACTGIISFYTAAALILGENIGTTITAKLASIGATTNARRAANAHMIFNVLGVVWIAIVFPWYARIINKTVGLGSNALVAVQAPLNADDLALFNVDLDANDLGQLNAGLKPDTYVVFNTSLDRHDLAKVDPAAYAHTLVALKSPLDPNGFATLNSALNTDTLATLQASFNSTEVAAFTGGLGPATLANLEKTLVPSVSAALNAPLDSDSLTVLDEPSTPYQNMMRKGIALTHSGFNILNTLLFIPLLPFLARVVTWMVPEKRKEDAHHLTFLDVRMLDTPAIAVQESQTQLTRMGQYVRIMMTSLRTILDADEIDQKKVDELFEQEQTLDLMQKEITEFITKLLSGTIPQEVVDQAHMQVRVADEYESISDYITNILKLFLKKKKSDIWFPKEAWKEILSLHDRAADYVQLVDDGVRENHPDVVIKARSLGTALTNEMKESRSKHLVRVAQGDSLPLASLIFVDVLNAYRRVKDHGLNIAEALAGEK
jgi:Na/Pi-cotransporter